LTVIDLSRVLSGPYCSLLLADLGARVIKVEPPGAGDDSRGFAPMVNGRSAYFAAVNRGKESIALDLKAAGDRVVFERLLDGADVLLDNFRPGVLSRLGFPAAVIEQRWPRLVHASISGFGQEGPLAGRAAYDLMIQAMGGLMSVTGAEDGEPARVGTSIVDIAAGLFAAIGILAALQSRATDGRGRFVDIAMLDCTVALLEHALARVQAGDPPRRLGARFPTIAPSDAYRTSDGWIVIGAVTEAQWIALTRVLGLPGLAAEPQFGTVRDRVANQALLKRRIEDATVRQSTAQWDAALGAAGVACGPVRTPAELLADPQLAARGMLINAAGVKVAGNPVRISGFVHQPSAAPELDGSRAALLAEFL
jgi:CoA:oxalate CoA-transferase